MPLVNPLPVPASAAISAVMRQNPAFPTAGGDRHRATFSQTNYPFLPSIVTEVVWVSQYINLDADVSVTGILASNGWATQGIATVTAAYTTTPNVALVFCNASGGPFTVTLADATQSGFTVGQRYTFVKTDSSANVVSIVGTNGQLVAGGAAALSASYAYLSVAFDGANWQPWSSSSTGSSPTGTAGGALAGSYPNPSLSLPVTAIGTTSTFGGLLTVTQQGAPGAGAAGIGITGQNAADAMLGVRIAGDTNNRFKISGSGGISWGTGGATADTLLTRVSAAALALTDGGTGNSPQFAVTATTSSGAVPLFQATNNTAGDLAAGAQIGTDTVNRWTVNSNGTQRWGPGGTVTTDTQLSRSGAGFLTVQPQAGGSGGLAVQAAGSATSILAVTNTQSTPAQPAAQVVANAAGDASLGIQVTGDSFQRLSSDSGGKLQWGPGTATTDVQISRSGANTLTVASPSAGAVALAVTGSVTGSGNNVLTVTNTHNGPSSPSFQIIAQAAGDLAAGIMVTTDINNRCRFDSNGKINWGPGTAGVDTDLFRGGTGTLSTDSTLTVGTNFSVTGTSSLTGYVTAAGYTPYVAAAPTVATCETFPRVFAQTATTAGTSGTLYLMSIMLPSGLAVNNLTLASKSTALTGTLQHGWYVLCDSSRIVRAVTADQTSGTWMAATNTPYTLPTTSTYTTTYSGLFYAGVMATTSGGTGMPNWAGAGTPASGLGTMTPVLCGSANTAQTVPPSTGATMSSITSNVAYPLWAMTS